MAKSGRVSSSQGTESVRKEGPERKIFFQETVMLFKSRQMVHQGYGVLTSGDGYNKIIFEDLSRQDTSYMLLL